MIIDDGAEFASEMEKIDTEYSNKACTFSDVEDIAKRILSTLQKMDIVSLRKEMDEMNVDVNPNPTTFELIESMSKCQAYKSRLTEISNRVEHEYLLRKRINDMLFDANQAVSKQSSIDKRRGEATMRYPVLLLQFENINSFRTEVNNRINNMRAISETLSRQSSLLNMQISLGEYRKKLPSDFVSSPAEEKKDYKSGVAEIDWHSEL